MRTPTADTAMDLGDELAGLVHGLSRAVSRATRAADQLPDRPESQVAVLRRLATRGPMSPAQLAVELQLARPTISNLVRELTAEGLLDRRPSAVDGRSVLLVPTERGHAVHEAFSRGRVEGMARALDGISAEDRRRLLAALPPFRRLQNRLQAIADAGPDLKRA